MGKIQQAKLLDRVEDPMCKVEESGRGDLTTSSCAHEDDKKTIPADTATENTAPVFRQVENVLRLAMGEGPREALKESDTGSLERVLGGSNSSSLFRKYSLGKIFSAAELCISRGGEVLFHKALGSLRESDISSPVLEKGKANSRSDDKPLIKGLAYDLGSITQVLATVTIFIKLMEQKLISPDLKVSRILQTFGSAGKEAMTLGHLLTHTSGLPAWMPVHRTMIKGQPNLNSLMTRRSSLHILFNELYRARLENLPGKVYRPSDLGFLLLGQVLEVVTGTTFSKLYSQLVAKPLKLPSTGFIDLEKIRRKDLFLDTDMIVSSAYCPWRRRVIHGEVNDEICWALGGVSSHSGLFGTVSDLHRFGELVLAGIHDLYKYLPAEIVRQSFGFDLTKKITEAPNPNLPFGWQLGRIPASMPDQASRNIYYCLSKTGAGLWLDPVSGVVISLMTNAGQFDRETKKFIEFVPDFISILFSKETFS
ncbi:MAG TPA: serine hydrolase domain-containing protein [Oligoflexia bacterium]|nr:serine hydrolase domain-containing protein [Oligoflexia bacterium]HMP48487.1 serine hydrolase domain-containing protein [Oligoflexia bacterium]